MTTRLEVSHAGKGKWFSFREIPSGIEDFLHDTSDKRSGRLIIFADDKQTRRSSVSQVPINPDGIVDMKNEQPLVSDLCKGDEPYILRDIMISSFPYSLDIRVSNIG